MNPPDTTVLRIGAWRVDPPLDEISKDGLTVKLEPRAMQLLLCLAEHQGQVVSVEELLSAVWKDVVVTADSVYHTVAALRRVLGDSAHEPVYIANVVRRGYRLVASAGSWVDVPTTPAHDSMIVPRNELPAVAAGKTAAPASSAVNDRSIAALPLTNLSADGDNDYFGDGLAEEILNALSQVPDLRVAARSLAFSFKSKNASVTDIAERLHVATVLEGSVRRAADRLRITVQLIDAKSGFHLWSERYDRQFADIFEIQDEIARAVVARFQLTLSAASTRPTANVEAYELYIRGRYEWHERTPTTMQSALRCFEESSRLDPSNALAFTGLADCYAILANYGWMPTNTARTPASRRCSERPRSHRTSGRRTTPRVFISPHSSGTGERRRPSSSVPQQSIHVRRLPRLGSVCSSQRYAKGRVRLLRWHSGSRSTPSRCTATHMQPSGSRPSASLTPPSTQRAVRLSCGLTTPRRYGLSGERSAAPDALRRE